MKSFKEFVNEGKQPRLPKTPKRLVDLTGEKIERSEPINGFPTYIRWGKSVKKGDDSAWYAMAYYFDGKWNEAGLGASKKEARNKLESLIKN